MRFNLLCERQTNSLVRLPIPPPRHEKGDAGRDSNPHVQAGISVTPKIQLVSRRNLYLARAASRGKHMGGYETSSKMNDISFRPTF